MDNPYTKLPEKSFWKTAVANKSFYDISDIWDPKFNIKKQDKIVTFGSCFAQHIGKAMKQRGYRWLDTESAPFGMNPDSKAAYNYGVFSARTGNIYTTTLLEQWVGWALNKQEVPDEIWEKDGRFFDPFRPKVEPNGFASKDELYFSRSQAVSSFRRAILHANYFVFTLGLTESWKNIRLGYEYPMCPGTIAGNYDEKEHQFENQSFARITKALVASMEMIKSVNRGVRFIFTVSPVPLTATNTNKHVLVATMASKSTLRAVVDQVVRKKANSDYFPSYEIINSPVFKGSFFEPNQRSVNPYGVDLVMTHFFKSMHEKFGYPNNNRKYSKSKQISDLVCEEELLEAFQK